jgi:hypothetical protein
MKPGRGETDEDVVDRSGACGTAEPLTIVLMQVVVDLGNELA